jgi:hypothetical protein
MQTQPTIAPDILGSTNEVGSDLARLEGSTLVLMGTTGRKRPLAKTKTGRLSADTSQSHRWTRLSPPISRKSGFHYMANKETIEDAERAFAEVKCLVDGYTGRG